MCARCPYSLRLARARSRSVRLRKRARMKHASASEDRYVSRTPSVLLAPGKLNRTGGPRQDQGSSRWGSHARRVLSVTVSHKIERVGGPRYASLNGPCRHWLRAPACRAWVALRYGGDTPVPHLQQIGLRLGVDCANSLALPYSGRRVPNGSDSRETQ